MTEGHTSTNENEICVSDVLLSMFKSPDIISFSVCCAPDAVIMSKNEDTKACAAL